MVDTETNKMNIAFYSMYSSSTPYNLSYSPILFNLTSLPQNILPMLSSFKDLPYEKSNLALIDFPNVNLVIIPSSRKDFGSKLIEASAIDRFFMSLWKWEKFKKHLLLIQK